MAEMVSLRSHWLGANLRNRAWKEPGGKIQAKTPRVRTVKGLTSTAASSFCALVRAIVTPPSCGAGSTRIICYEEQQRMLRGMVDKPPVAPEPSAAIGPHHIPLDFRDPLAIVHTT